MSKAPSAKRICAIVHASAKKAEREWRAVSGDDIGCAPEYWLSVHALQAMKRIPGFYRLEEPMREVVRDAVPARRGRLAIALRATGRCDLVHRLQGDPYAPRGLIEFKTSVSTVSHVTSDVKRILRALTCGGSSADNTLNYGIVHALTISHSTEAAAKKLANTLLRGVKAILVDKDARLICQSWEILVDSETYDAPVYYASCTFALGR